MKKIIPAQQLKITKKKTVVRGLGTFCDNKKVYLFFQLSSDPSYQFHVAESTNGFSLQREKRDCFIKKGEVTKEDITLCHDFSISKYAGHFLMTYVRDNNKKSIIEKAWSKDLLTFEHEGNMISLYQKGIIVQDYSYKRKCVMYASDTSVSAYFSKDVIHWEKSDKELLTPRKKYFDSGRLTTEAVLNTENGLLLIYHSKVKNTYLAGVALFDSNDPENLLWRCQEPVWTTPKEWDEKKIYPIGAVLQNGHVIVYWQIEKEGIYAVSYLLYKISDGHSSKDLTLRLKRAKHNPLIAPKNKNSWESFNTFNPAAVYDNGKVHLVYRAQGYDYISVLGYATSKDGLHIDERLDYPIYIPSESFENIDHTKRLHVSKHYVSAGYGGCEDPRITKIDDRYYLTYVAFDGTNPPRIALTSITVNNFLNRRWLWERPVLISPPGVVDKSAVIFPEKIRGKYVIMHRIYPDILIDFVDTLNFDGTYWLKGEHKISPRKNKWDSRKIGAGAPPLRTKYGWLLIYQSVGEQDPGRYKIGAMLLDLKDPTKVLHRSQSPILEPEKSYENGGFKAGVIYPCGAVIIDKTLYVYYGSSDSYVCVATANLEEFLKELRHSQVTRLTTPIIEKIF